MEPSENVGKVLEICQDDVKRLAGEIADKAWASESQRLDGPMVEMEDFAAEVSRQVGARLLQGLLASQAEASALARACPKCGGACEEKPPRRRVLTTRVGEVVWHEPVYYCRCCRRSFSPSIRETPA
jgi:hypothetical protein